MTVADTGPAGPQLNDAVMMQNNERIVLGHVAGVYGVKGWVKIISHTRPRENILDYGQWWLGQGDEWRLYELAGGRAQGKGLIAALTGVSDRDGARSLIGADIAVERSALPETAPGEYYWCDLVGLRVQSPAGEEIGRITGLQETGANDVLIVRSAAGHEQLIPYVPGYSVLNVDLDTGVMTVDWQLEE